MNIIYLLSNLHDLLYISKNTKWEVRQNVQAAPFHTLQMNGDQVAFKIQKWQITTKNSGDWVFLNNTLSLWEEPGVS